MNTLLSYHPGGCGEFLCNLIQPRVSTIIENNRYVLSDNYGLKNLPHDQSFPILDISNACVPTHWFGPATYLDNNIRLYSEDEETIKISYVMWWLKSHASSTIPWNERILEVKEKGWDDLLDDWHNWKYMARVHGIKEDLRTYIEEIYYLHYKPNFMRKVDGWTNLDLSQIIYGDKLIPELNSILNIELDIQQIKSYAEKNKSMTKGLLNSDNFFDDLYVIVENEISNHLK